MIYLGQEVSMRASFTNPVTGAGVEVDPSQLQCLVWRPSVPAALAPLPAVERDGPVGSGLFVARTLAVESGRWYVRFEAPGLSVESFFDVEPTVAPAEVP